MSKHSAVALSAIVLTILAHCARVRVSALETGLVAHYTFSGNALDVSGFGNHGTVAGATLTTDRFGGADSAYQFDGLNDNIRVTNSATLSIQQFLAGYSI